MDEVYYVVDATRDTVTRKGDTESLISHNSCSPCETLVEARQRMKELFSEGYDRIEIRKITEQVIQVCER